MTAGTRVGCALYRNGVLVAAGNVHPVPAGTDGIHITGAVTLRANGVTDSFELWSALQLKLPFVQKNISIFLCSSMFLIYCCAYYIPPPFVLCNAFILSGI
jgi:hypothetical protein